VDFYYVFELEVVFLIVFFCSVYRVRRFVVLCGLLNVWWSCEFEFVEDDDLLIGEFDVLDGVVIGCMVVVVEIGMFVLVVGSIEGRCVLSFVFDLYICVVWEY